MTIKKIICYFLLLTATSILAATPLPKGSLTINQHLIQIEIAQTPQDQEQGLGDRTQLPANSGMYFIFTEPAILHFWMKDMHFPLDMVWIRNDKVIGATENIPPPVDKNVPLVIYSSPEPADKVLELNAGAVKTYGIKVGDAVFVTIAPQP